MKHSIDFGDRDGSWQKAKKNPSRLFLIFNAKTNWQRLRHLNYSFFLSFLYVLISEHGNFNEHQRKSIFLWTFHLVRLLWVSITELYLSGLKSRKKCISKNYYWFADVECQKIQKNCYGQALVSDFLSFLVSFSHPMPIKYFKNFTENDSKPPKWCRRTKG